MVDAFRVGHVTEHKVQCWRRFLNSIRKQTAAASDYLAMQELLLLLYSILLGTVTAFLGTVNGYGEEVLQTSKVNAFSVTWLLFRKLAKVNLAERVTDAVSVRLSAL